MRSKSVLTIAVLLLVSLMSSCYVSTLAEVVAVVSAPTFEILLTGDSGVLLEIKCSQSSSEIYFGADNTCSESYSQECMSEVVDGVVYSGIYVPYGTTVYAIAKSAGMKDSSVSKYDVMDISEKPVISKVQYNGNSSKYIVTISTTKSAAIYYTINGSDPNRFGILYSPSNYYGKDSQYHKGILVDSGKTLKVYTSQVGKFASMVYSYSI